MSWENRNLQLVANRPLFDDEVAKNLDITAVTLHCSSSVSIEEITASFFIFTPLPTHLSRAAIKNGKQNWRWKARGDGRCRGGRHERSSILLLQCRRACQHRESWYTATATVNVQKLFPKLLKLLSNKMSKDCILVIANFLGKYRVTVIYNELYLLFLFVLRMHHVVVT